MTAVRKRDYSLDILRIMACVMVVGIHTSMEGWYGTSPRTYLWTVLNFYDTVMRPAVPLFLMISGALLLGKERIDIKRLWCRNIFRIAIIYLVWATFYAVMNNGIHKAFSEPALIWEEISGPNPQYHLWYLRTLLNLYAIAPVLWVLVRAMDQKTSRYYSLLFFVFAILVRTVYELPFTPGWLHEQINLFVDMDLVGYAGYFILGYYFCQSDVLQRFGTGQLAGVYFVTMFAAAGLNQWIAWVNDWPTQALYGNFSLPVAIETVCLFTLIRRKFAARSFSDTAAKWLVWVSDSTLFVYLIHPFVLQRVHLYLHLYTTDYNVLISVPLMILAVSVVSSAVGMILKKIPLLNRFL